MRIENLNGMSSLLPFAKLQATGNDFVLLDMRSGMSVATFALSCFPERSLDDLARAMCKRRVGVGSDGLLLLRDANSADFRMQMFNPDGTEDMCGNGIRCAACYALEEAEQDEAHYRIETMAGIRDVTACKHGGVAVISVNMGKPSFDPSALPTTLDVNPLIDYPLRVGEKTFPVTCLSTGTPHTCIFSDAPIDDETFLCFSHQIENHPDFPERTSVLWICPLSPEHLWVRIWERAVGETLACGTGACAALAAAHIKGLAHPRAKVESRGGRVEVEYMEDGTLRKTGPAELVFRGHWRKHK